MFEVFHSFESRKKVFVFCKKKGWCNSYRKSGKHFKFSSDFLENDCALFVLRKKVNLSSLYARGEFEMMKTCFYLNFQACKWQNWRITQLLTFRFSLHIDRHHEKFIHFGKLFVVEFDNFLEFELQGRAITTQPHQFPARFQN